MTTTRDRLGRERKPQQSLGLFRPAREGAISRSHNVNARPDVHDAFARLTPQERGDLIEQALAESSDT